MIATSGTDSAVRDVWSLTVPTEGICWVLDAEKVPLNASSIIFPTLSSEFKMLSRAQRRGSGRELLIVACSTGCGTAQFIRDGRSPLKTRCACRECSCAQGDEVVPTKRCRSKSVPQSGHSISRQLLVCSLSVGQWSLFLQASTMKTSFETSHHWTRD